MAEDSGLEVFALGGEPGVHSKRFALPTADPAAQDAANNRELLRRLAGAPEDRRRARYRCVIVYLARPDAVPQRFDGQCLGRILDAPVGTGGFGYDPLFFSDDLGRGFAEVPLAEKQRVSHRARAFGAFVDWLLHHDEES